MLRAAVIHLSIAAALTFAAALPSPTAAASPEQQKFLAAASGGVATARALWWDRHRHWYRQTLRPRRRPLATLWGSVPLFEALDAIAIANPTPATRGAAAAFARGAERYWDPALRPGGGFQPYPGAHSRRARAWFDDNGWWGVAFVDAYVATGDRRFLTDARRALGFIVAAGWDPDSGGVWWSTIHEHKAGESVAAGTWLATRLYAVTGDPYYLAEAQKMLLWANTSFIHDGVFYDRRDDDPRALDYIQGPMISAQAQICRLTGAQPYCDAAESLAASSVERFSLSMAPIYDSIFVRCLLDLYRVDGNATWYDAAAAAGRRALAYAGDGRGAYLRAWDGGQVHADRIAPGMLQTHAATVSVFAWLAATPR